MYPYETLLVLQADLPEAQLRETIERAKQVIEGMEGKVSSVDEWGVRDLAYPIQKQRRGYYALIQYNAAPQVVWELERTLKIADDVLRFVSVRQRPQAQAKKTKKRAERPKPPREDFESEVEGESTLDEM